VRAEPDGTRPQETFSEFISSPRDNRLIEPPSRMIRSGPWKLYKYHVHAAPVMYNLDDDPREMQDLGVDPEYESIRAELLERLHDGWDPEFVRQQIEALDRDMEAITAWDNELQPRHEDDLPVPEYAEEVELR